MNYRDDTGIYPHNEALQAIKNQDSIMDNGWQQTIDIVNEAFNYVYGDIRIRKVRGEDMIRITMITGGWSGNEAIEAAMNANYMICRYYKRWKSGGEHVWELPEDMRFRGKNENKNKPIEERKD